MKRAIGWIDFLRVRKSSISPRTSRPSSSDLALIADSILSHEERVRSREKIKGKTIAEIAKQGAMKARRGHVRTQFSVSWTAASFAMNAAGLGVLGKDQKIRERVHDILRRKIDAIAFARSGSDPIVRNALNERHKELQQVLGERFPRFRKRYNTLFSKIWKVVEKAHSIN